MVITPYIREIDLSEVLKINGSERHFPGELPGTLAELLDNMKINQATVVAEIDGAVVSRENFSKTEVRPGQSIELVRFVGGG